MPPTAEVEFSNHYALMNQLLYEGKAPNVKEMTEHGELSRRGLILGRKTCGAGGGGFMIVHTAPGRRKECLRICEKMGAMVWPVSLDFAGVRGWDTDPLPAADVEAIRRSLTS